jgi:hypothetical protein
MPEGRASASVRPWFQRLVEAIPGPTLGAVALIAAGFAVLQGAILGSVHWVCAPLPPLGWPDVGEALARSGVLACTIWMGWFVVRGFAADLAALRPATSCSDAEFERLLGSLPRFSRRGLVLASLAGALVPLLLFRRDDVPRLLGGESVALRVLVNFCYLTIFYATALPLLYVVGVSVLRMWRFGRDLVRVDLLDLAALQPFARFGLRPAFLLNLGAGLIVLDVVVRTPQNTPSALLMFAPVALLGLAALLLPCGSVRGQVRQAKVAELGRLRSALGGDPDALRGSPLAAEAGRLSTVDLVVWRDRVEALREWPFDASVLRRFGLYLLIPLASWVGAALVERLVDRLF